MPSAARRAWGGFVRPFQLLALLWAQPVARAQWLRVVVTQVGLTVALGSAMFVRDLEQERDKEREQSPVVRAQKQAQRRAELRALSERLRALDAGAFEANVPLTAVTDALSELLDDSGDGGVSDEALRDAVQPLVKPSAAESGDDGEDEEAALEDAVGAVANALGAKGATGDGGVRPLEEAVGAAVRAALEAQRAKQEAKRVKALARVRPDAGVLAGGPNVPPPPPVLASDEEDDEKPETDTRPWWYRRLVLWASSLVLVQTVVLAFTRDHQDRVAFHLSLLAGVQPEDVPGDPRLRIDLKWLWRKLRRRIRGTLVLVAGVATLFPVLLVGLVVGQKDLVFTAVVSVVSSYWWVVFTAARSARAWRGEEDPTPPRPLRVALEVTRRWRWLRFLGVPVLVRLAVWASSSMAAPARNIERDLPRFAGLAVTRVLASIPVVRVVLRAPIIVAAAEALEATADAEVLPAPASESVSVSIPS